jgi:hypothetical protein
MAPKVKRKKYESDIEGTVAEKVLLVLAVFSIKLKRAQESGYPDRMFLIPGGRPLFIEFKREGKEPEPYQVMIHERLRYAGYTVEVHDTVEGALRSIAKAVDAGCAAAKGRGVAGESSSGCAILRSRSRKD